MKLSDQGTLIVPVQLPPELQLPETVVLGKLLFHRKEEFHITIFGYRAGKEILSAVSKDPSLLLKIEEITEKLVSLNWHKKSNSFYQLKKGSTRSIIMGVEFNIQQIYDELRSTNMLFTKNMPFPHITLYTNEKNGNGIGIDHRHQFIDAVMDTRLGINIGNTLHAYHLDDAWFE